MSSVRRSILRGMVKKEVGNNRIKYYWKDLQKKRKELRNENSINIR